MDFEGLSVDQAPPITAPLRFFITAPLFALLAGVLMLFGDAATLSSRFAPQTIAITHAITIGFFSFVMFGALVQMLPVLAGVKIARVEGVSKISYLLLLFGTLGMVFGLWFDLAKLLLAASLLLGGGFLLLLFFMLFAFRAVVHINASIRAMITSLVFALLITLFGAHLLASYGIGKFGALHPLFANVHSVWAIFGFAGILIIGVAFHILPMFYVAPKFEPFFQKFATPIAAGALVFWLLLNLFADSYAFIAKLLLASLFMAFAFLVLSKLKARRRKVSDITIWYWKSAAIFMALGAALWVANDFLDEKYSVVVSLFIGGGFIFSIMSGMLYKIVPFLVWFHLNAKGYMSIPTMNDMMNKKASKWQFGLFVFSLVGLALSFFVVQLLPLFALTFIISMVLLELNIVSAVLVYRKTLKTEPEFDMSMFMMKAKE